LKNKLAGVEKGFFALGAGAKIVLAAEEASL
jgi:hypothetical protein